LNGPSNIKYGSSFDQRFLFKSYPFLPLINIIGSGNNPIRNLDELITLLPRLVKNKYFTIDYINYGTGCYSYTDLYYFSHMPLNADIKYNDLDNEPTIFSFNEKTLQWERTEP
jgi:hypothetical protein